MNLPFPYALHVLSYQKLPYITSNEIATWFKSVDDLRGELNKSHKTIWSIPVKESEEPSLFKAMAASKVSILKEAARSGLVHLYSLKEYVHTFEKIIIFCIIILQLREYVVEKQLELYNFVSTVFL